jgi:hypothetical protein
MVGLNLAASAAAAATISITTMKTIRQYTTLCYSIFNSYMFRLYGIAIVRATAI